MNRDSKRRSRLSIGITTRLCNCWPQYMYGSFKTCVGLFSINTGHISSPFSEQVLGNLFPCGLDKTAQYLPTNGLNCDQYYNHILPPFVCGSFLFVQTLWRCKQTSHLGGLFSHRSLWSHNPLLVFLYCSLNQNTPFYRTLGQRELGHHHVSSKTLNADAIFPCQFVCGCLHFCVGVWTFRRVCKNCLLVFSSWLLLFPLTSTSFPPLRIATRP